MIKPKVNGLLQEERILRLYHVYRVVIGALLVSLISSNFDDRLLDLAHAGLFQKGSWLYLLLNLAIGLTLHSARRVLALFAVALLDVLLLCALIYSAGGAPSGLGNLLVVAVAIANFLLRGRVGLVIAASAAIGLLVLTFFLSLEFPLSTQKFVQAGTLGALCFASALFVQALTARLAHSETLAEQRAVQVADLQALNAQILERMRTGILVVDSQQNLLMANQSAQQLMGRSPAQHTPLADFCAPLLAQLQHWQNNPTLRSESLQPFVDGPVIQPSFVTLNDDPSGNILIFLEDSAQIAQHAQQLKLASLGRLTAGIAHEIRNPLGAISHAAQLLQESDELNSADQRLVQIVQDQSKRMNLIIENILQLSRRRQAEPQLLDLRYWLHRFVHEFRSTARADQQVHIDAGTGSLQTRMDAQQLNQVLGNLVQNGLRYSGQQHKTAQVWLNLYRDADSELPVLEVVDDGPGVPDEQLNHLFEPFYTTENKGTGLGLYISRELCESNQARLDYKPREGSGGCFRITFAHPRKLS